MANDKIKIKKAYSQKATDSNELLRELIMKQLKNIPQDKKLQYTDLKRICKYIDSSIFNENSCSIWSGYITNVNNSSKGTYVNFYFRKKKAALHRLLYINFIDNLTDDEYLKFNCENKGKCCNIHHLKKFKYQKKDIVEQEQNKDVKKNNKNKNDKSNKIIKIFCNDNSEIREHLRITFY